MEALLTRLADSTSSAEDLEQLTRPLLELLEAVTGLESTYLTTIDEAQGVQHILYARNVKDMEIPEGLSVPWNDTLCKRAMEEGRPYTNDVETCWGDSIAARALGIKTYVSQPVHRLDGALYGTLCAASGESKELEPATLNVLTMFARLISHQVERERVLEMLRKTNAELAAHALTDPLTGLANRRAMRSELQRMLAQAERDGDVVQVAFIDLDGFKQINDEHGHDVGDRFLMRLADRLDSSMRAGDLVARYGGDEFVVLAPGAKADDLRQRLERATVGRFSGPGFTIDYDGASVGVTACNAGETGLDAILARADADMYAAKKRRKH